MSLAYQNHYASVQVHTDPSKRPYLWVGRRLSKVDAARETTPASRHVSNLSRLSLNLGDYSTCWWEGDGTATQTVILKGF